MNTTYYIPYIMGENGWEFPFDYLGISEGFDNVDDAYLYMDRNGYTECELNVTPMSVGLTDSIEIIDERGERKYTMER